ELSVRRAAFAAPTVRFAPSKRTSTWRKRGDAGLERRFLDRLRPGKRLEASSLATRLQPWVGFAPSVHPIYSVTLDIVSGGGLNGWKEVFFPNLREQPEPLELVL